MHYRSQSDTVVKMNVKIFKTDVIAFISYFEQNFSINQFTWHPISIIIQCRYVKLFWYSQNYDKMYVPGVILAAQWSPF